MIFQFHFYLSLCRVLHFMCILTYNLLHCTWFDCIRSCKEDPSHEFLANRWLVHSYFMSLGNPLEIVVHHLLIKGMSSLGYWDLFPMVSALICMVTYRIRPTVNHDLRLSSSHYLTKLLYFVTSQLWENIEFVLRLVMALTYGWDHKLIIYSLWIGSLLMEVSSYRYS